MKSASTEDAVRALTGRQAAYERGRHEGEQRGFVRGLALGLIVGAAFVYRLLGLLW
jgi:hypothetical protein